MMALATLVFLFLPRQRTFFSFPHLSSGWLQYTIRPRVGIIPPFNKLGIVAAETRPEQQWCQVIMALSFDPNAKRQPRATHRIRRRQTPRATHTIFRRQAWGQYPRLDDGHSRGCCNDQQSDEAATGNGYKSYRNETLCDHPELYSKRLPVVNLIQDRQNCYISWGLSIRLICSIWGQYVLGLMRMY